MKNPHFRVRSLASGADAGWAALLRKLSSLSAASSRGTATGCVSVRRTSHHSSRPLVVAATNCSAL